MKKLISIITILTTIYAFVIAQEVQNDISDIDVDVDVIVEAKDVNVLPITTDEILNVISQKLNKNAKLTEEQKQKILNMVQQKLQNKEVPQLQLCIEVCKVAELKWRKGCDVEVCKKDIENIEKRVKEEIEKAQQRVEKTFRKKEHLRAHLQQAKEVLQKLVENGVPVQNALDIITSIPPKDNLNVSYEVKVQLENEFNKGESLVPNVLPQELKNRLQLRIKEELEKNQELQLRYQEGQSFEYQIQNEIQNTSDVNQITTMQQHGSTDNIQIQNPMTGDMEQYQQILNEYIMNKPDASQQPGK